MEEPPATDSERQAPASSEAKVKRKRSTRNLILRAGSALTILALAYFCLRWDVTHGSQWAWACLIAGFTLPCLYEFYRLAQACEIRPFCLLGFIAGPAYVLAQECDLSGLTAYYVPFSAAWAVIIVTGISAMLLQLTRKSNDNALNNVAITVWGVAYCSILPGLTVHLRHLHLGHAGDIMEGVEFAVVCIFITKVSDVGALLIGSQWGKRKLIPRLSPGKTWEGAFGGIAFSVFLLQFMTLTNPAMALARLGRPLLVLLSLLLAMGGLAGDLIESAFKRNSHRKDAGTAIPGFGGVLDLMDSLMVATPVMYFFLVICGAKYVQ